MNDGQSKSHAVDPLARYSISPSELKGLLATERSGMPFLAYRDETGGLATFVLPDDDRAIIVGRRDGVDLRLAWDEEVSGIHAELRRMGG